MRLFVVLRLARRRIRRLPGESRVFRLQLPRRGSLCVADVSIDFLAVGLEDAQRAENSISFGQLSVPTLITQVELLALNKLASSYA